MKESLTEFVEKQGYELLPHQKELIKISDDSEGKRFVLFYPRDAGKALTREILKEYYGRTSDPISTKT